MSNPIRVDDIDRGWKNLVKGLEGVPKSVDIGIFGGKHSEEVDKATRNEFGIEVPERSFMRSTFDDKVNEAYTLLVKEIKANLLRGDVTSAFKMVGSFMTDMIKNKITTSKSWAEKNRPSTIARKSKKGRIKDTPLIDSGRMRASVVWRLLR